MPKRGAPSSSRTSHQSKKQRTSNSLNEAPSIRTNRKGFTVGPDNLPDGTYRRKVQKIKKTLVQRAKLRKGLDKIKRKEGLSNHATEDDRTNPVEDEAAARARMRMERAMQDDDEDNDGASSIDKVESETTKEPTVMVQDGDEAESSVDDRSNDVPTPSGINERRTHPSRRSNTRRPNVSRYTNEIKISRKAEEAKAERDRITRARVVAAEKRERERKTRNKAMGGGKTAKTSTGQMKLGRQSRGLLEKVQHLLKG
ncbi:hypothetical protein ABW21_db0207264 [Orbilia brochopaga]|nr:hypothetical protein ABW21_db0207264 [Drechslerella brochopaga]